MPNTIIRASAGSGKTFLLSNTFLNILFQSETSVEQTLDSILASTFTRKAAGEIIDRIFTKFADVALNFQKRKEFSEFLHYPRSNDMDKGLQTLLAELARNMYRLRVGTLDSYFNKIASAFSLELGLPTGWTMMEESEYPHLISEAVREVFNESEHNNVKSLMNLLQKGEEPVNITSELVKLANNMLPLIRITSEKEWDHNTAERLAKHTDGLLSDEEMERLIERVYALSDDMLPQTAKKRADKVCSDAWEKVKKIILAQNWKEFLDPKNGSLVSTVIASLNDPSIECKFNGKNLPKTAPELFSILSTLLPHVKSIFIRTLIFQTRATYTLLKFVDEKLDKILERERKFRYENITQKIADFGFRDRLDSLKHRLNADTKHLLLDEFQDTSLQQWEILEPLALQAAGNQDGTYFCVGDEKQSIYSWRGGEAAIFASMKSQMEQALPNLNIDESTNEKTRRCAGPIIDTVNTVFTNIQSPSIVAQVSENAAKQWNTRFKPHSTANEAQGYCVLEESSPCEEDEKKDDAHLKYVVERIKQLIPIVQRPELKNGIGILVARRNFGAKIVSALREEGIETSGNGVELMQSPAVRHIVSALIFAEHPGNTIARFHLAHGPLADVIGLHQYNDSSCSRKIREDLVNDGYGTLIGKYMEHLVAFCDAQELERLEKLREIAYRFDGSATGVRTRQFITQLENERISHQNAARIQGISIHASKGLEFDMVVLPELDGSLAGRTTETKYVVKNKTLDDPTSPIEFVLRYPVKALQNLLPDKYQKVFQYRVQRNVEESLCKLYVAMTRAVRSLIMIIPPKGKTSSKDKTSATYANFLREKLATDKPMGNVLYETGNPNWYEDCTTIESASQAPSKEMSFERLECQLNKRQVVHHVPRITPSLHASKSRLLSDDRRQKMQTVLLPEEAALKGTLIHACFEHGVDWLDLPNHDQESVDHDLRDRLEEMLDGRVVPFTLEDILEEFHAACRKEEIVKVLSQSRYLPDQKPILEKERRFAVWIGNRIMRGSMDRLVIQHDFSGAIAKIEILDYKTGDLETDIDMLVTTYREQLNAYREAVRKLYGVRYEIVESTLVFVTLGKVARVFVS